METGLLHGKRKLLSRSTCFFSEGLVMYVSACLLLEDESSFVICVCEEIEIEFRVGRISGCRMEL